jgi:hypothetical protein
MYAKEKAGVATTNHKVKKYQNYIAISKIK